MEDPVFRGEWEFRDAVDSDREMRAVVFPKVIKRRGKRLQGSLDASRDVETLGGVTSAVGHRQT